MSATCSGARPHNATTCPLSASTFASAVPQLPAPMTAISIVGPPLPGLIILQLSTVRVMPLGGCGEFGRNLTVYEAEGKLLCVDCGGQIPDDEAPGGALFIPDFAFLAARAGDVVGWLLTHAHEDHIAALPHALMVAPAPVYARPLT